MTSAPSGSGQLLAVPEPPTSAAGLWRSFRARRTPVATATVFASGERVMIRPMLSRPLTRVMVSSLAGPNVTRATSWSSKGAAGRGEPADSVPLPTAGGALPAGEEAAGIVGDSGVR